ncbi:MAG: hypothetical protein NC452_04055 [Eubacterium sp.]|nr:hypothetical protein [Eubacterium sp.]
MNNADIEKLVQAAVNTAVESKLDDVEEKVQAALNLGATVGAQVGAEVGAAAAIKAIEREQDKLRKKKLDRKLHNTKLLLKNYRTLQAHYKHAVYDVDSAEENDADFAEILARMNSGIYNDDMYIESIKQSCVRTKIIMTHVNSMLDIYEAACNKSGKTESQRRWRELHSLYLSSTPMTAAEIATAEHIGERTVYKDIDVCVSDLSTLFFGIGALKNM